MSGRGWGETAVGGWRDGAPRYFLAGLIVFLCLACVSSVASADVDSVGGLEKVPAIIKSSPHELTPLAKGGAGLYQCSSAHAYADIHSEPWGFVIGQCKSGWKFEVLEHTGVNSETGTSSYGGYLEGAFDACGWIESDEGPEQINEKLPSHCPGLNQKESTVGSFMEKYNGQPAHNKDGYYIVNKVPCKEYANYRPWSSESVGKEEIRTVPAYEVKQAGTDIPALKWRYVTKYASTDGSGKYVMVRDARLEGGEGNWVFVPRSCLPATLPESEGELVPSPPTVTTGTPTGIATPNATLVGFVNPNGLDTKYFFEYGTTTSYGSYTTTGDAGSGTGVVQEDVPISGLAAGTTYYFRIVASSATGETFGGPVAFTTQPRPEVSTKAASEVKVTQVTLNASVNPEELGTHYYFEYGPEAAEPGHYPSTTAEGYAGTGTGGVSESATLSGLQPLTAIHYRIVARSSAGISYGADEAVKTPILSKPSVVLYSNGTQEVFYRGNNGQLYFWLWNTTKSEWSLNWLGSTGAMAGDPHAVLDPNGSEQVYYRGTNGKLYWWFWNTAKSEWSLNWLESSHPLVGEPVPVLDSNGSQQVYYRGASGVLYWWFWNTAKSEWSLNWLESSHPMAGEPSPVLSPEGTQQVYYRGTNGQLYFWLWNAAKSEWSLNWLGATNAMGGEPTPVLDPDGTQQVYYGGSNEDLDYWLWNVAKSEWSLNWFTEM
jgi:hypothetical protein